jgi:penicillin-binding protein 1A
MAYETVWWYTAVNTENKSNMKKLLHSPFVIALCLASLLLMFIGAFVWFSLSDLPSIDALKNYQPPQSTVVLDRSGNIVGRFYDERRTVVSLKKLPEHVKRAFIAAEDADFFEHRGIDYFGLMRAVVLEIKYRLIGGRRVGGSTITQQAARTMLLTARQTYVRKLQEIVLAQRIEDALSKEEILHLYLNQIYFGSGAYGIEEAAQTYFKKPAAKLTLFEAAALASVPKSPNRINPFSDAKRLKERQDYVLDQMVKHQFISAHDAEAAKQAPLFSDVADNSQQFAQYFLRAVKNELLTKTSDEVIRRGGMRVYSTLDVALQKKAEEALTEGLRTLDKQGGYRGPLLHPTKDEDDKLKGYLEQFKKRAFIADNKNKIWDLSRLTKGLLNEDAESVIDSIRLLKTNTNLTVGVRVLSVNESEQTLTIDLGSRTAAMSMEQATWARKGKKTLPDMLHTGDIILVKIRQEDKKLIASLEQEPQINGGIVALDVATGAVLAMAGGYDFERSPFNRITQAKRQPGSGLKPLIYALALEDKVVTPVSIIADVPKAFLDPGTNEFWRPRNWTNKYLGDITFRHCLRASINTCTITLLEKIGIDRFLKFAEDVELSTKTTPYPRNLTIALGSAESYPINVANAMRVLANQGVYSPYHMIDSIKHTDGKREKLYTPSEKQVLSPAAAFVISNILQAVLSESKRHSHLSEVRSQLAGKTGTTNNARSTWFFGYSPKILTLVYVGYDDNRSIGADAYGINTAFPTFGKFMNSVPEHREPLSFSVPNNIEWRYVDQGSGQIKEGLDENAMGTTIMEAFIAGTVPDSAATHQGPTTAPKVLDEDAFAP